jgi:hypothetical protein
MIGTSAALLTTQLANAMPGASAPVAARLRVGARSARPRTFSVSAASFWLPEPKQEELPD